MSKREPKLLIGDILASATKILDIRKGKHLKTSKMTVKRPMLIRNFEIIGEAANRLPDVFRKNFPEIDLVRIRGFRNRIVHD